MKNSIVLILLCFLSVQSLSAQKHLNRKISVDIQDKKLKSALKVISANKFTFSYNTRSVNGDSIVTVYAKNKEVIKILRTTFDSSYDFKEVGNYVIIRRRKVVTKKVIAQKPASFKSYYIKGYVVNESTGEKIPNATVFEKNNLLSSQTDENGYFSLKLKKKFSTANIHISKENFIDTTVLIKKGFEHNVVVALQETDQVMIAITEDTSNVYDARFVEVNDKKLQQFLPELKGWLNRNFVSARQKVQNLNLKKFTTTRNFQASFVPGLSTHGRMNAQVVNKVSLNIIGGYSAGTSLVEVGGIYNLDRKDVKFVQAAGIMNAVGGSMQGAQIAGIYNEVAFNANGLQFAGIQNKTDNIKGVQLSGIKNKATAVKGLQIAGLVNLADKIKGLQIGLINKVTEENTGWSLGLINISKGKNGKERIGFILRVPRKS